MADPTTLSGSVMFIEYSDTPSSAKKSAVCQSEGSFDGSRNVVSDETNCGTLDRKSTRLNSSHVSESRMPSSA